MAHGISVVIPAFNEELYISDCLSSVVSSLDEIDCPNEVIVVDNCSSDETVDIARSFNVSVYTCSVKGPSACRNKGFEKSKFDIICFIDGDCIVTRAWFDRVINIFKNDSLVGAYGGPVLSPMFGSWVERCWSPTSVKGYYALRSCLPGANFSIRRSVFEELGGFNEMLITAEDDDLSNRVSDTGYYCINDSDQSVIHLGYPKSLADVFIKQLWHSSSQIKSHGLLGDKMVVVTLIWIISFALMVYSAITLNIFILSLSIFLIIGIPVVVSIKRNSKNPNISPRDRIISVLIALFFIGGRSIGLIRELAGMSIMKISGFKRKNIS